MIGTGQAGLHTHFPFSLSPKLYHASETHSAQPAKQTTMGTDGDGWDLNLGPIGPNRPYLFVFGLGTCLPR